MLRKPSTSTGIAALAFGQVKLTTHHSRPEWHCPLRRGQARQTVRLFPARQKAPTAPSPKAVMAALANILCPDATIVADFSASCPSLGMDRPTSKKTLGI